MSRQCSQPVFQDRFPVMGTGHVLIFRVMDRDTGTVVHDLDWWTAAKASKVSNFLQIYSLSIYH